ncbi:MAG: hypothetical protein CMM02_18160 [Rhodopirellula sp.]|nr:hypothetical protein [Rhodopirellula sp.]
MLPLEDCPQPSGREVSHKKGITMTKQQELCLKGMDTKKKGSKTKVKAPLSFGMYWLDKIKRETKGKVA